VSDCTVHADRTHEKNGDDDPEGERARPLLPSESRMNNRRGLFLRRTTVTDVAPTERQPQQQRKRAERNVRCPPTKSSDNGLRNDREDHGA
jgi:hypothetical protein